MPKEVKTVSELKAEIKSELGKHLENLEKRVKTLESGYTELRGLSPINLGFKSRHELETYIENRVKSYLKR